MIYVKEEPINVTNSVKLTWWLEWVVCGQLTRNKGETLQRQIETKTTWEWIVPDGS